MPHFIFFHGILINAEEFMAIYVDKSKDSGNAVLFMMSRNETRLAIPLDVPYEQAKTEWIETLKAPPVQQHTHADGTTHTH